jgi:chemotaxis family two-component system sensor kinase Cph1
MLVGGLRGMRATTLRPTAKAKSEQPGTRDAETIRRLEQQNTDLRKVVSVAAHDLREPLRALRSCAERLVGEHGQKLDGEAAELLEWLAAAAGRTEQLASDLLMYSGVLSGPLKVGRVDLEEPLDWALANLRERIEEPRTRITRDRLPVVRADTSRMIQLFQNLLGNALTYRGNQPATVHVGARRDGDEWVVYVRDSGIGVKPGDRDRIFDPFERLHAEEEYPGTGLGLAISRQIVEEHNGRIWMEPTPGGGSTFAFTLPPFSGERDPGQD